MPPNRSRRRPLPFLKALPWFLPGLLAVAVAATGSHPLTLIPLLLANALTMAAVCHAIGFDPEPRFDRTVLRRGAAHLVMFTGYVALVFVLVAWPMLQLSQHHAPWAWLLLAAALLLALAALWRAWPAYGLAFVWDDAYPAQSDGSWLFTAVARCLAFGKHLAREERFFTHFLPAAFSLLLLAFVAVALTGLYGVLAPELRIAALAIYGVVLLPLGSLVVANRTLRAMLCERHGKHRDPAKAVAAPPPSAVPALSEAERTAGAAEQAAALLVAARCGDIGRALALVEAGADPAAVPMDDDPDQRSAMYLAALMPDTRLLRALIARGAPVNQSHRGMSVLLAAARDGGAQRGEAIITLVSNGADVTATDPQGGTALHHTARRDDLGVAVTLLDAGAPLDAVDGEGLTPLAVACRAANWKLAELLLARRPQFQPAGAEPALVAAAGIVEDDPRGVAMLLKHKAKVDARDAQGRTALIVAAQEGHARIAAALLAAHADVGACDRHGTTALMEAARHGAEAIVRALLDAGASPDPRDRHGRDALALACRSPHASAAVAQALVDAGADPAAVVEGVPSALDIVAADGRHDLLAILDPDAATRDAPPPADAEADESPAHLLDALRFGHWQIVARFEELAPRWPAAQLGALYLELAGSPHAGARRWLLAHGMPCEPVLADGCTLWDALLAQLPASADALHVLLDAGASPAGAGRLAQALDGLAVHAATGLPLALRMLDAGADPFGALPDGRTPLHLVAAPGWFALLARLADAGVDPNARDARGRTPLHAVLDHPVDVLPAVQRLIGAGADPEATSAHGETPLGLALAHEAIDSERWLRWSGWPLPRRRLGAHDLIAAATAGDAEAVDKLLAIGFAVDTLDAKGSSALLHACGLGHLAVVERLLAAGADVARVTPAGVTPLAAATSARQLAVIERLLRGGAQVDQPLRGDATALMLACALGHADVADRLIAAGAGVNAADAAGHTPLHAATQYCFAGRDSLRARRLLDALLGHGADPNRADQAGLTPLLLLLGAHMKPGVECDATHLGALVPVLLDAGARHDHADQRGVTALHACAMHVLLPAARALLSRGADRGAVDAFGRTPSDVARLLGYVDLAAELAVRGNAVPSVAQTLRRPAQPAD